MKAIILSLSAYLLATCLVFSNPADSSSSAGEKLGLAAIFSEVEGNNLILKENREFIEQARQAVARERSGLLPAVDLNATQSRRQQALIGSGFEQFGIDPIVPPANRFDVGLSGSVALVDPMQIARFRRARIGADVANLEFDALKQEILYTAGQLYFTLLRDQQRFEVIQANIEVAETNLELAKRRLEAGASPRIDVTRAEVRLANEQQAFILQESTVFRSELQLLRFLNRDLEEPIAIQQIRTEKVKDMTAYQSVEAASRRADLRAARERIRERQTEVRAARWERFPSIRLFGEYGYANEVAFRSGNGDTWAAGISLSMPIFEGLRIRSNERLARSRLRQQEFNLENLEREIQVTLRSLFRDIEARQAQIQVARRGLSLAEEELELARDRFAQGATNNFELVEAQAGRARAADQLVEALFVYNLTLLDLALAQGEVRDILDLVSGR